MVHVIYILPFLTPNTMSMQSFYSLLSKMNELEMQSSSLELLEGSMYPIAAHVARCDSALASMSVVVVSYPIRMVYIVFMQHNYVN